MARDTLIEVVGVTVGYAGDPVLRDVSMSVKRGRVTTIIGGSGCGKSTLLRCMVGLLQPWSGKVKVFGRDLYTMEEAEREKVLSKMGLLFQHGALLNSVSVAENVALPLREHTDLPEAVIREIVRLKLELVGLWEAHNMLPGELSGGMRKRAALARAMALDPEILLCDEPTSGLDPQMAASLDRMLLRLRDIFEMTVVVVTHEIASIETVADHVVMLGSHGNTVFAGTLEEAKSSKVPEVVSFFSRQEGGTVEGSKLLDLLGAHR